MLKAESPDAPATFTQGMAANIVNLSGTITAYRVIMVEVLKALDVNNPGLLAAVQDSVLKSIEDLHVQATAGRTQITPGMDLTHNIVLETAHHIFASAGREPPR